MKKKKGKYELAKNKPLHTPKLKTRGANDSVLKIKLHYERIRICICICICHFPISFLQAIKLSAGFPNCLCT